MVGKALPPLRFHLRACGEHFFWKFGPLALNHGHDAAIAPGGADFEPRAVPKLCLQIPAKQDNRQREVPDEILQRELRRAVHFQAHHSVLRAFDLRTEFLELRQLCFGEIGLLRTAEKRKDSPHYWRRYLLP
jgi:hypothetical protein